MMGYYHIWTIGCQMNEADSRQLGEQLEQRGLLWTADPDSADVVVLNSCVVRQHAEDKVVNKLANLKAFKKVNPDGIVALMGCMVDARTGQLGKQFPQVDVFMRPQQFEPLLEVLESRPDLTLRRDVPTQPMRSRLPVTCNIPVIHGCNEMCTYCIVPFRRGRERSRPIDEIVEETRRVVARGAREITLLGQIVDSYGHDLPDRPDLADLLAAVNNVEGLQRIRFLTSHPRFMSDRIIEAVASLDKVCEHINIPFQAGDDDVLRRMRRTYTNAEYRDLIRRIRQIAPGASLSTDVIVGFCGETDEEFECTLELLRDVRFDKVHVAAYSPRPGTHAARWEDDVPLDVKKARLHAIEALQEQIGAELNAPLLGSVVEVLVEGHTRGKWQGRTRTNKLVYFEDSTDQAGQLVTIKIEHAGPWSLSGHLLTSEATTAA